MREALWIRMIEGAMHRDEGNYELSHIYNNIILSGHRHP